MGMGHDTQVSSKSSYAQSPPGSSTSFFEYRGLTSSAEAAARATRALHPVSPMLG